MVKNKEKASPSRNREKLIWGGICLGVGFWMFCLGILVGRGSAPVHFDTKALQKELTALKQAALENSRKRYPEEKPPLKFYEALKGPPETVPPPAVAGAAVTPLDVGEAPDPSVPRIVRAEKFKKPSRTTGKFEKSDKADKAGKAVQARGWTVQVAALKDPADADRMVARLVQKGYAAYQLTEEIPGKGLWHRVRVGHYGQRQEARSDMEKLRGEHYSPLLMRAENRGESP
jgi:cell division septation protein DedD